MRRENGNALVGIIVIILILLLGGAYFWDLNKKVLEERRDAQERARAEALLYADYTDAGQASVIDAIR